MLVGQVVVEPVHKIGSFLELGSFQGPGGVFVLVDDLPLAEETLESGGSNHPQPGVAANWLHLGNVTSTHDPLSLSPSRVWFQLFSIWDDN